MGYLGLESYIGVLSGLLYRRRLTQGLMESESFEQVNMKKLLPIYGKALSRRLSVSYSLFKHEARP